MKYEKSRWEIFFGVLLLFVLFFLYRLFTVYTVRSGECRPKAVDPSRRLATRDENGVRVSYPERSSFPQQQRPLTVMTYNIAGHDQLIHGDHIAQIAAAINSEKPDIVTLQEVHRKTWQSRYRDQLVELEAATHMHGFFGKSYAQGNGQFGNAILTRGEIVSTIVHPLPSIGEPRTIIESVIRIDGATINVYTTHLTTWDRINADSRREQLECVANHVRTSALPYILAGDFNAAPDAPEIDAFRKVNAAQVCGGDLPETQPLMHKRIDYVFADYGWEVRGASVPQIGPSDHWPVVVQLMWDRKDR
ncbi:MAG: endonuclease/exonuclease/phosphatase family protein [Acidobacteriota bacterium]